jgi:2'-5' RNA ligase
MMNDLGRFNSSPVETWRLFIAVPMPVGVREIIGSIEEQLKAQRWPFKWVHQDLAHITLKFLGDTQTDLVPVIERELEDVTARRRGSEAAVGEVGAFPSTNRARVIWLGLNGSLSPLAELAQDIDGAMTGIGFSPEDRPFNPHITLGRLRRGKTPPSDLVEAVERLDIPGMNVPLDRVQLVHSVLSQSGPAHTILSEWQLGPPSMDQTANPIELVEHG